MDISLQEVMEKGLHCYCQASYQK